MKDDMAVYSKYMKQRIKMIRTLPLWFFVINSLNFWLNTKLLSYTFQPLFQIQCHLTRPEVQSRVMQLFPVNRIPKNDLGIDFRELIPVNKLPC